MSFDEIAFEGKLCTHYFKYFKRISTHSSYISLDKPSFGPTYLHLYDPIYPSNYVGRVLMELRSETMQEGHPTHVLITESVSPPANWSDQSFVVEFLPILGDHIPSSSHQYKFVVQLAEFCSNELEGPLTTPSGKFHSHLQTKSFRQESPYQSCLFRIHLPDNRIKFEADFFMIDIANYMVRHMCP